ARVEGRARLGRPEEAPRRAAGLRRDEGAHGRGRAREPLRRREGATARRVRRPGRRRLAAGAPRLSGGEARAQGEAPRGEGAGIELRTLTDGGQPAEETARALAEFVSQAQSSLDIAISDVRLPVPPPARTRVDVVESLPFPTVGIPGEPDLMHHKYVVRDGASVWTG